MAIKTPRGYRVISGVQAESLDVYIQAFSSGSGQNIVLGSNDFSTVTVSRGTRTRNGAGATLQLSGGSALGTDQVGGDINILTGYSTGNAAAGSFSIKGDMSPGSSGETPNAGSSTMFGLSGSTGDATFYNDIIIGGNEITNTGSDNDLIFTSDKDMYFTIDKDEDTTNNKFVFRRGGSAHPSVELAELDESGNLQIDGSLTVGSTEVINSSAQVSASAIPTLNQSTTGSAATLTTSRDLKVDLTSTSAQGFNGGSSATSIGVNGILPVANGGTGTDSTSTLRNTIKTGLYAYEYLTWEVNTNSFTSTNYELPALNGGFGSDNYTTNSGTARNPSGNGSTNFTLAKNGQQMGWYVPHACKLVGISGLFRNNGALTTPRDVAVFVGTPDVGSTATPTYTQQAFATGDVDGGQADNRVYTTNVTLGTPHDLSAGEVVMPAVCCSAGSGVSMQGNFSIIIATPIQIIT